MPELPHGLEAQTRRLLRLLLIRRQALPIGSTGKDLRFGCAVWELNATTVNLAVTAKIEAPVAQSQSEKLPPRQEIPPGKRLSSSRPGRRGRAGGMGSRWRAWRNNQRRIRRQW